VALLAGCADSPPPPPPPLRTAAPPAAGPAAPPAGASPLYDGNYAGQSVGEPDRTRACRPAPRAEVLMQVRGGQASLLVEPELRQVLTGTVLADGTARLVDRIDRTIVTTGQITNGVFAGYHRNGPCRYTLRLEKRN
jgi:hypothetical protein